MGRYFQVKFDDTDPFQRALSDAFSKLQKGAKQTLFIQVFASQFGGDADAALLLDRMQRFVFRRDMGGDLEGGDKRHKKKSEPLQKPVKSEPLTPAPTSDPLQRPDPPSEPLRKRGRPLGRVALKKQVAPSSGDTLEITGDAPRLFDNA